MKKYIKPSFEFINLITEERLAHGCNSGGCKCNHKKGRRGRKHKYFGW